ncbi:GNAT family N-acetyltransferase [Neobacillus piezotolerans]|uniref:GNAT family N-acetyltransferase n=1 Tax=Neobacillus piezotolerans TaxID=2259171 RepID=A0A3D8GMV6_9BACI|nr:GNAT family N-acetyltransferase [Neobacillus piezotolerans]RDU35602.1 GNAT family N-acetyltransferase [Neobacillus piezotolerans]
MDIDIRRPKYADAPELHLLFRTVISDTYIKEGIGELVDDMEDEIQTKEAYLKKDFSSNGEERHFLVASKGGRIVGTIEFGPASSLILECTHGALSGLMEVGTVFVHPEFQQRGIGSLLLSSIFRELGNRGIDECCLDSGYRTAQKIWKKRFGEPEYVLKDFWGKGFDHMIWKIHIR